MSAQEVEPSPEATEERVLRAGEWAMCAKKRRYGTRAAAVRAAARRVRKAAYLRTYRCPFCAGWHLTHKRLED